MQWQRATSLLCLVPDVMSYSSLITACEKVSEWIKALALLKECETRLRANVITFNATISACRGQWRWAFYLFERCRAELQATQITFNAVP